MKKRLLCVSFVLMFLVASFISLDVISVDLGANDSGLRYDLVAYYQDGYINWVCELNPAGALSSCAIIFQPR